MEPAYAPVSIGERIHLHLMKVASAVEEAR